MPDKNPKATTHTRLDDGIAEWRAYLHRRQVIPPVDADELEDHLRSQVSALIDAGLSEDEAFLIAVRRMGSLDRLTREYAREHSERLWKRLVLTSDADADGGAGAREALVAVGLAVAAAGAIKLPELFGAGMDVNEELPTFYLRNMCFFVLPFLAVFFAWKRGLGTAHRLWLAAPFVLAAVAINALPFSPLGQTEVLSILHLPMALWFVVGYAYASGRWRDHDRRMHYARFSGEWFIYYALIALGGGVLMALTGFIFSAIGVAPDSLLATWVLPCGAVGAAVIAAWLVEAKQRVIENMAPVLTLLFTPLFTLMLLSFLATMVWTGNGLMIGRELLIGFDLLLALVAGLVLYAVSARNPQKPAGLFDALQLVLIISALLVDAIALGAIAARISEFGFSPNKVAALGENLILFVTLGVSAVHYGRFLAGKVGFAKLERWQTTALPVYALWAWAVVLLFPLLFGFV